ncbi:hypothetical protein BGW36DRAFT_77877 [Talaromyces proteolyticus]|uniref:Uncharacterized protein n=1 Tax=Talaromyces proteolyticus TaxID=1131652 RepID=A0AAD4KIL1_9EURO|nr:uncharacterized protein BGW36DRAFT_77877 [Talaromyces proteolyticus]KAH8689141.1 hypothetical protein BGW36DRAFT_77877 [Talaromyces proteolyticus]
MAAFNPTSDIPSLEGKVILITGANAGIGKETAIGLAKHNPAKIFLACRNASKASAAIADIQARVPNCPSVEFLQLDLASFSSVREAAATFKLRSDRLDILINNAGVAALPPGKTKDGNEIQLGTNHLGHFLLTKLLLPVLQQTAAQAQSAKDVRIVNLSSIAYKYLLWNRKGINFEDLNFGNRAWHAWGRYAQSKLSNILFTKELAARYPELTAVVVHPGVIDTDIWENNWSAKLSRWIFRWIWYDAKTGSHTTLFAATAGSVQSGDFYFPIGKLEAGTKLSNDPKLAKRLWEWSEERVGAQ